MTLILKFLKYNDIVASTIAILSNAFLVYLILTVNKSNLKQLSYTLLQNCLLDSILAIVTLIGDPQIVVVNGIYYNIIGSPLYSLGFVFSTLTIATFGASLTLSMLAMPVPFYIRYLVLCKNIDITKKHIIKTYALVFGSNLIIWASAIWCCQPFPEMYEQYRPALMNKFWLDEYPSGGPTFCAIHPANIRLITVFSLMFIATFVSYILIIYFSIKITQHLKRSQNDMSKKTKVLNRQLQRTLTVQAIGPLITGNLPICVTIILIFLQYENHYVTLGLSCFFGWIAVINPVAAIIIITPYRIRVKQLIGIKDNQITINSSTGNIATPSTKPPFFTVNSATVAPMSVAAAFNEGETVIEEQNI